MLDSKKIGLMTKCAIYESHEGAADIDMAKYYKSDYVRLSLVKRIVASAIGYCLLVLVICLYNMDEVVKNFYATNGGNYLYIVIGLYVLLEALVIFASYKFYTKQYKQSHERLSKYYKMLGEINKLTLIGEAVENIDVDADKPQ